MPSGLVRPNSEIEPIVGIQFGIFSPEEIERRSVVEITNAGTYDGNEPRISGLFDPRMGVLDNGKTCRSCGQTNHHCPGHFGHYSLARPVYYIQFFPLILNTLSCICVRCSKLLIDKELHKGVLKSKGEVRWRKVLSLCSNVSRCGAETEDGCGARQPDRYVRDGIARISAQWDKMEGPGASPDGSTKQSQILEVEYVLRLFRRLTDEDVDFMGLNRFWCRPDWMICSVLAIPPPQVRPSVIQDNNQRSEDDLTHKLFDIINTNKTLQDKINNNAAKNIIDEYTNVLQYHIATLVDNQIPGVAPSAQRSGRPLKSIQQRLGSKEGRIRYNIQGKRVEFSARSVITPDPNLSVAEIGVPLKIAMNLTVPVRVTPYNREQIYKYIQNGADKFPGAKTLIRQDGRMISLRHVNTKEIVLHYGDTVNRHLMNGDIILFNRQPTLHRMSMMGHRVRVLPFNTFRLNVSVTSPYNADFDGDEMNAHIPQSLEASTELTEIAAVPHQIVTPRHAKPVIGIVQDTLVGSWRITRPKISFNRREFMNMLMWNKRFEGVLPQPARGKRFTGQQVLSQLLPPINLEMGNSFLKDAKTPEEKRDNYVVIKEGQITQGIIDKDIFSKPSKGIVHTIFKDYGSTATVNFIDTMQSTLEQFLVYNGFSVGISDLVADENTRKEMDKVIKARKAEIENILLQVHLDLFDNNTGKTNQQEFEDKVYTELNKATELSGKIGLGSLAEENRLIAMVRAGSKGSTINIAQMMACVGQQAPEGRRIPYGFTDRTLPHYKKYDDGAEARGFVESSFIQGLTPQEFFFHAMSGREGLIDTAVKSVTGDTKIVLIESGITKCVAIGDWIDSHLAARSQEVEHFTERSMELLQLASPALIPTSASDGTVSWSPLVAVTRHDPGERLYKVTTLAGKTVTVTEAQSLLVWSGTQFEKKSLPEVKIGDCVPVTARLASPPVLTTKVNLCDYLPKTEYLYGTDFIKAVSMMRVEMEGRKQIPRGWWEECNGTQFTLPYDSKARLQRCVVRSNVKNIQSGYVYPFTTNREHTLIPESFELNKNNGIFLGLFLAEGNVDVKSGYVQITNNKESIREFVAEWFEDHGISSHEDVKLNHIGDVSSSIRGFSTVLAEFLTRFVGHGAANKRVPAEVFTAPEDFLTGLLNGYISGDGTVSQNSIEASSCSAELIDGMSMVCTRLGIFAKVSHTQAASNNLGTETILPTHRLSIRAQWASAFVAAVDLIDENKALKLANLVASESHRNFASQKDVVLDEITEIEVMDATAHPKVYDLTVPSTFNFGLANGLHVRDTADTGYIQRQLVKAMEDLTIEFDGTVRDARKNVLQFHYGEDGCNSTKIETQSLGLAKLSEQDILTQYSMTGVEAITPEEVTLLQAFASQVLADRTMLVEKVYRGKQDGSTFASVNLDRLLLNISVKFQLAAGLSPVDLTPSYVIEGIEKVLKRTQPFNALWGAMLRFWLAPHKLILKERYTRAAFDTLCELIIIRNWQAWSQPGEQVGIIAAQSIGEPSTQMTLNTFHLAGVAAKSNVTRGVPRLKELLKVTRSPKAISLTIYLKKEYREDKEKAREAAQDLELTLLRDVTTRAAIYYDPKDSQSVFEEDRDLIAFYRQFESSTMTEEQEEEIWSKWMLRIELDRERLFGKNISMEDISFVLRQRFGDELRMIYSDFNSPRLIMRIRLPALAKSGIDDLANLKKFVNRLLNGIVIRGVPGIKSVTFRQDKDYVELQEGTYKQVQQYVLDTDGSNFQAVMSHPLVDGRRLVSSHVHDILENLGVEATRAVLLNEISTLFEEAGVNYRHLGLLCDVMTRNGRLISADRYGINKNDIGPLAKASFEETEKILLRAAVFGETDPVTGVSANIMTGQVIRGGTAFSQILLDEVALLRLQENLSDVPSYDEPEAGPTEEQVEAALYESSDDICSDTRLRMSLTMPTSAVLVDEPDVEMTTLE